MVNKRSSTLLPVSEEELKKLLHAKYPEVGVKTAASTVLQLVLTLPGGGLPHQTVVSLKCNLLYTLSSLLLCRPCEICLIMPLMYRHTSEVGVPDHHNKVSITKK